MSVDTGPEIYRKLGTLPLLMILLNTGQKTIADSSLVESIFSR